MSIFNNIASLFSNRKNTSEPIEKREIIINPHVKTYDATVSKETHSFQKNDFSSFECLTAEEKTNAELLTIDLMEGHDFEHWCANALKDLGFSSVRVTPGSGDHGVDVLAEKDGIKYAIQCKRYSSDLGNTPVQEVFAGKNMYNCHVGVVLTNQHFTSGAKHLADVTGVLLWDRNWIKSYLERKLIQGNSPKVVANPYSDLFCKAVEVVLESNIASVDMLRRRLNIGYAQAARLIDEMEERGIVGEFRGSAPRKILISKKFWDSRK